MEALKPHLKRALEVFKEMWADSRSRKILIGLVVLLVLVNWPAASSALTERRLERDGEIVSATVIETTNEGTEDAPVYRVTYRLPPAIDSREWQATLADRAAFERARISSSIRVRVMREQPELHRVEGVAYGNAGLWFTLIADVLLLGGGYVFLRTRRRDLAAIAALESDPHRETDPDTGLPSQGDPS